MHCIAMQLVHNSCITHCNALSITCNQNKRIHCIHSCGFSTKSILFFLVFISVPSCLSININFCKSTKPIQFHVVIYFHYAINWWGRPNYKWRSPISVWMRQFWSIFFTSLFQWNYYLKGKPPSELPQGWLGWSTIQIRLIQTADIEFVFLLIRGN